MTVIECCGTEMYGCDRTIEAATLEGAYDLAAVEHWAPVADLWRCPWCRTWQARTDEATGGGSDG